LCFFIGIAVGIGLGSLNGIIVTRLRINAMVATIGMQGVYSGITLVITRGRAIIGIPDQVYFIGKGSVGGMPVPFIIAMCMLVIVVIFVTKTKGGRYIYVIGNSKPAAQILGIKVDNIRVRQFAFTGFFAALAGLISLARLGTAQAALGTNWPLNSIAACVIGGILLTGGVGNPIGAVIGAAILSVISNLIVLLGVDIYFQSAVNGIVVVVAIALPSLINMYRERSRIKEIARQ
jgi:ribose transport system permease protein